MEIQDRAGVHALHPEGDLTIFEAAEFHEALLSLCKHDGHIELDTSSVERLDSSGIQLIIAGLASGRLNVTGMKPPIVEKMKTMGCGQWITKNEKHEARNEQ